MRVGLEVLRYWTDMLGTSCQKLNNQCVNEGGGVCVCVCGGGYWGRMLGRGRGRCCFILNSGHRGHNSFIKMTSLYLSYEFILMLSATEMYRCCPHSSENKGGVWQFGMGDGVNGGRWGIVGVAG